MDDETTGAPDAATELAAAWQAAQLRLPEGWHVDSLRCASGGLEPSLRSEDWIAVAIGPDGEEVRVRAADPIEALAGLPQGRPEPAAAAPGDSAGPDPAAGPPAGYPSPDPGSTRPAPRVGG